MEPADAAADIRESDSAQLIGRAHAGATLRVKSRETGWVSMAYLGPADAVGNTPQPPTYKVAKFKAPEHSKFASVTRHSHPTYARLPAEREFVPPRRRGLFGLFL